MIAEFEACVQPLIERCDTRVNFAGAQVEFVLVDEADGGNLLLLERGDDVRGHVRQFLSGHGLRGTCGEVVHGDDDAAVRKSLRCGERRDDQQDGEQFGGSDHGALSRNSVSS